eukprot:1160065-Pelagomonas_calceolata.AAC.2
MAQIIKPIGMRVWRTKQRTFSEGGVSERMHRLARIKAHKCKHYWPTSQDAWGVHLHAPRAETKETMSLFMQTHFCKTWGVHVPPHRHNALAV